MRKTKTFAVLTAFILLFSLFACTGGEEVHNIEFEVIDNFSEQLRNFSVKVLFPNTNVSSCCHMSGAVITESSTPQSFEEFDNRIRSAFVGTEYRMFDTNWIGRVVVIGDHKTVIDTANTTPLSHTLTTLMVLEQFHAGYGRSDLSPGDTIRVLEHYHIENDQLFIRQIRPTSWVEPLIAGEEYVIYLNFEVLFSTMERERDARVSHAIPVTDSTESLGRNQSFTEYVHQANIAEHGASEANERLAFRQMLIDGAREKYLGIAPPVSGQPGLAEE